MTFKERAKKLWNYFTTYEKIWFFSIVGLSILFAFLFPEEETQGVNGGVIMALYLVDIFSNVACELLISKQSKYNFLVSLVVELTEIAICLVLSYRFATMASTLFFWIPIDIISFIQWNKHKDAEQEYNGIFSGNPTLEVVSCYLDACCSAVGIANGLFILFRYREQWIAWYLSTLLETILNIMAGQWILLILKAGYFTNTTYGYIKWTKYIKSHEKKQVQAAKG